MNRGNQVQRLLQEIHRHRLADRDPDYYGSILAAAEAGMLSDDMAQGLLYQLEPEFERAERIANLLPRPPEDDELPAYDIELGECVERPGTRLGIRILDRPRHILSSGATGMGKSTFQRRLIYQIHDHNLTASQPVSMICICIKGDYSALAEKLGRDLWGHHSVHGFVQIGLNPPRSMMKFAEKWIDQIVRILAARCGMIHSAGSLAAMIRLATHILSKKARGMAVLPNLGLLRDIVEHPGSKDFFAKPQYRGTVTQILRDLSVNASDLLGALIGFDVNDYVRQCKSVVIDCTGLEDDLLLILIDLIVSQLLLPRLLNLHRVDGTEVCLFIDEGDGICSIESNEQSYGKSLSPLGAFLKQGREFGLMACLAVTHLAKISQMIRTNVSNQYFFAQPDPRSLLEAARSLGLERGGERLLLSLPPGQCIHLAAPSALPIPILMKVDDVPADRGGRPTSYDRHSVTPGLRLVQVPELKAALDAKVPPDTSTSKKTKTPAPAADPKPAPLRPEAQQLLFLAAMHPFYPVVRCWEKAKSTPTHDVQNQVNAQLDHAKLAEFTELRIGSRNQMLIELTDSGWQHIGMKRQTLGGGGTREHRFMINWIRMHFEKLGREVRIEFTVSGTRHRADVAVRREDGRLDTLEVAFTCDSNLETHIRSCFEDSTDVASLTVVSNLKKDLRAIEKQLRKRPAISAHLDHVQFEVIDTYMKGIF